MATYLTQEWLELQRELWSTLPERPGASLRLQTTVSGAPGGDVSYTTTIVDGTIVESALGADRSAEVVLAVGYADSVKILRGELDANAAFMQGRVKVTGDMGRLLTLMPLTRTPENQAVQAELAARTELP